MGVLDVEKARTVKVGPYVQRRNGRIVHVSSYNRSILIQVIQQMKHGESITLPDGTKVTRNRDRYEIREPGKDRGMEARMPDKAASAVRTVSAEATKPESFGGAVSHPTASAAKRAERNKPSTPRALQGRSSNAGRGNRAPTVRALKNDGVLPNARLRNVEITGSGDKYQVSYDSGAGRTVAQVRRNRGAKAWEMLDMKREHGGGKPAPSGGPNSYLGGETSSSLKHETPIQIDTKLFPVLQKIGHHEAVITNIQDELKHGRVKRGWGGQASTREPLSSYDRGNRERQLVAEKKALAEQNKVAQPMVAEYNRRGGWPRYTVVQGGHLHCDRCHTVTPGKTLTGLQPQASGLQSKDVVGKFGEHACTHCFPGAPVIPRAERNRAKREKTQADRAEKKRVKAFRAADRATKLIAKTEKWLKDNNLTWEKMHAMPDSGPSSAYGAVSDAPSQVGDLILDTVRARRGERPFGNDPHKKIEEAKALGWSPSTGAPQPKGPGRKEQRVPDVQVKDLHSEVIDRAPIGSGGTSAFHVTYVENLGGGKFMGRESTTVQARTHAEAKQRAAPKLNEARRNLTQPVDKKPKRSRGAPDVPAGQVVVEKKGAKYVYYGPGGEKLRRSAQLYSHVAFKRDGSMSFTNNQAAAVRRARNGGRHVAITGGATVQPPADAKGNWMTTNNDPSIPRVREVGRNQGKWEVEGHGQVNAKSPIGALQAAGISIRSTRSTGREVSQQQVAQEKRQASARQLSAMKSYIDNGGRGWLESAGSGSGSPYEQDWEGDPNGNKMKGDVASSLIRVEPDGTAVFRGGLKPPSGTETSAIYKVSPDGKIQVLLAHEMSGEYTEVYHG